MPKRILVAGLLCCVALVFAGACGQPETPNPTSPPSQPTAAVLPTSATTGDYQPIDPAECTALRDEIAAVLGVEVEQGTALFEDYAQGGRGTGCLITAKGTGVDFPSTSALASNLHFLLEDLGWVLDIRYAADGPTGTAFALRKENSLVLVGLMWTPSADADCPADKPISDCKLAPEQILYTITVRVAQK
jgi:hypothetical protein